jgi:hypothetical protein
MRKKNPEEKPRFNLKISFLFIIYKYSVQSINYSTIQTKKLTALEKSNKLIIKLI